MFVYVVEFYKYTPPPFLNKVITTNDLSFFNHKLCVYDIPFTSSDYEILWNFQRKSSVYSFIASDSFKLVYEYGKVHFPNKVCVPSFSGTQKTEVFPKSFSTSTLRYFYNYATTIFFLVDNMKDLSFIKCLTLPERFKFPSLVEGNTAANSNSSNTFFFSFFNNETGIVAVWDYLLKLLALDWGKYSEGFPFTVSLDCYRRMLDTLRQISIYFILYSCCRDTILGEKMGKIFTNVSKKENIWPNFCNFYSELIREINLKPVSVRYIDEQTVTVNGLPFSVS